jgi:LemA protein
MFSLPLIILGVAILLFFWGIGIYNRFVRLVQQAEEAWSAIDIQLKLRYDLIPNVIETVKGYASHERETLDAVIQARAQATKVHVDPKNITPETLAAMAGAEQGLSQALGKLMVIAEAYPDLKANTNFLDLQRELSDVENKIQAARRFYNGNVKDLMIALQQFPSNIIGKMFGFSGREYFELENDAAREVPKVSF